MLPYIISHDGPQDFICMEETKTMIAATKEVPDGKKEIDVGLIIIIIITQ